jgi:hypothetical protein
LNDEKSKFSKTFTDNQETSFSDDEAIAESSHQTTDRRDTEESLIDLPEFELDDIFADSNRLDIQKLLSGEVLSDAEGDEKDKEELDEKELSDTEDEDEGSSQQCEEQVEDGENNTEASTSLISIY